MNTPPPYTAGRQAYSRGVPLHHCPHPIQTIESLEWRTGWSMAAEENGEHYTYYSPQSDEKK